MKHKQTLYDTILLIAVFLAGCFTNSFITSQSQLFPLSSQKQCPLSYICLQSDNGESIQVDINTYVNLIDNEIQGTSNSNWMLKRRLGTEPINTNDLSGAIYRESNEPWFQLYFDLYDSNNNLIETFTPRVYKQS